jgi:hypothetical protein
MPRERILITVKTYPTLSRKHGETVCTAGIRPDGSWIRLYPVPFRRLDQKEQYHKFDWIECDVAASRKDIRPETRHPIDHKQLVPVGHIGTDDHWRMRRKLLLPSGRVYHDMQQLIGEAKANRCSLATFKPSRILDFI